MKIKLNVGQFFKKEHYYCSLKPSPWNFEGIPASISSYFRLVEKQLSSNPSSQLVYTDFGSILKRVLLFRAYFSAARKRYCN